MSISPFDASAENVLVADIGGTFARFCLARDGHLLTSVATMPRNSADDVAALCAQAQRAFDQPLTGAAIAIAAPVSGGRARMTNADWDVDEQQLGLALSTERVLLINDFAALALSLPALQAADLLPVPVGAGALAIPPAAPTEAPQVVFGPGTGLGVAALMTHDGRPTALASEGGHVGFAPATAFEHLVLDYAAARFERVSWERVLSGPGLEIIDQVSRRKHGLSGTPRTALEIVVAALQGDCPAALDSIACFAGLLGSFGGDLALMFRAGSVVIGGGIVARIAPLIALPALRQRFQQKGRFAAWLDGLPLSILMSPQAALVGAARAYAERFTAGAGQ